MAIPQIKPYFFDPLSDLSENRIEWRLTPERAVLLIHDMQEYFLDFFNRQASPVTELLENIRLIRESCDEAGIPVIFTAQPDNQTSDQRGLLEDFWGPGLSRYPEKKKLVGCLTPHQNDQVLTKWRYSAFHRTRLLEIIRNSGRQQLIICGIYAHIGCLVTATEAFMNDIQPFFVADGVADFSLEDHKMALKYVAQRCGVVTQTCKLLAELRPPAKRSKSFARI